MIAAGLNVQLFRWILYYMHPKSTSCGAPAVKFLACLDLDRIMELFKAP